MWKFPILMMKMRVGVCFCTINVTVCLKLLNLSAVSPLHALTYSFLISTQICQEHLINVIKPCRWLSDTFHREYLHQLLFVSKLLHRLRLLFFRTSRFLMPILAEKFPFMQKSSRTLVSYWNASHGVDCDLTKVVLFLHTGVLCAQPVKSHSLCTCPEERPPGAHHQQDAHVGCKRNCVPDLSVIFLQHLQMNSVQVFDSCVSYAG